MTVTQAEGLVLKNYNSFYYVQDTSKTIYECRLRGRIKERLFSGDRVIITCLEQDKGVIEKILPRKNELYRPKIANVSLVLIVLAGYRPAPSLMLLDRLLFLSIYNKLTPIIVLNKCDLPLDDRANTILNYYPQNGFNFIMTSAKKGTGIDQLQQAIIGEIAVMAGPSGVGKTSLLNTLCDRKNAPTGEVSEKIGRGKHTTRHVELYPLDSGGWIADTPGFSVLDLPTIRREELTDYFPDFYRFVKDCRFSDCIHFKETDCGVKRAVNNQLISSIRYNNYISMLEEVIANERCYK